MIDKYDKAGTEKSHPGYRQYTNTLMKIRIRNMIDKSDKTQQSHPRYRQYSNTLRKMIKIKKE